MPGLIIGPWLPDRILDAPENDLADVTLPLMLGVVERRFLKRDKNRTVNQLVKSTFFWLSRPL